MFNQSYSRSYLPSSSLPLDYHSSNNAAFQRIFSAVAFDSNPPVIVSLLRYATPSWTVGLCVCHICRIAFFPSFPKVGRVDEAKNTRRNVQRKDFSPRILLGHHPPTATPHDHHTYRPRTHPWVRSSSNFHTTPEKCRLAVSNTGDEKVFFAWAVLLAGR